MNEPKDQQQSQEPIVGVMGGSLPPPVRTVAETRANLAALVCEQLSIKTSVGYKAVLVMLENAVLLDKKQQDYGPLNITTHGEFGVLVRMTDKVARLSNLHQQKRRKPRNESVLDSYRDIANYAVIAILLRTGQWQ